MECWVISQLYGRFFRRPAARLGIANDFQRYTDGIRQDVRRWQKAMAIPSRAAGRRKKRP